MYRVNEMKEMDIYPEDPLFYSIKLSVSKIDEEFLNPDELLEAQAITHT